VAGSLFRTKSIAESMPDEGEHGMKRVLTATNLVFLGIGAIIGAGIFVLTGTAAANYAGPAIVFSYMVAGAGCVFAGLCYAEFASMIPVSGSAYTYGYATLGELVAWIIGWDLVLEYLFGAATVAVGWSSYFTAAIANLGIHIPPALAGAPFTVEGTHHLVRTQLCVDPATGGIAVDKVTAAAIPMADCLTKGLSVAHGIVNLPALLLVVALSILLIIGIKESARFNNAIVFVKVAVVLLVIGFGFKYVHTANWHPFMPVATDAKHFGWPGVVTGAAVVFFAYIGFDAVSTAAQEAKNPQRDLPIGMLGSLAICTVLYILMALVMTGVVPYRELNVPHPVYVVIEKAGPALAWLGWLVNIAAIAGLASVVLVMLMAQPRILYTMSRDGLLPPGLGKLHPKFRTPYIGTILTGSIAAVVAAAFPIELLGELVSIGTLLAFVIVSGGIMVLRRKRPDLPRPFKTPLVPLVPILGIAICGYMMYSLPNDTWIRLLVWLVIGFVIYFGYSRSHSKLNSASLPVSRGG
jgi:basic amino acid/polyamine antiporter, APA family